MDVQNEDVWAKVADQMERLRTVLGHANDVHTSRGSQAGPSPFAHHLMIVNDEYSNWARLIGSWVRVFRLPFSSRIDRHTDLD